MCLKNPDRGENFGNVKRTGSEQDSGEERDVSKSTSILGVELGKEAEQEMSPKLLLLLKKDVLMHKTEISVQE